MAKSIKVNPNILECNDFTTDKLKQVVVPQGCFCYPGATCNKVLSENKSVVPGNIKCGIELDNLVQYSLSDKKLYFSTSRIAVIVVRSHRKRDKSEKMINQGSTYPLHFTYLKKNVVRKPSSVTSRKSSKRKGKISRKSVPRGDKVVSEIAQLDVKFLYSLFVKGYTPLLIFEDGEAWMPFMERAQIINAALHKKHEDKLCGLPMNAAFVGKYSKSEDSDDEEEISAEIKDIETILAGDPVVPNYDVDPLGEKDLRAIASAEKQLLGGDPANAMSLLYRDSDIAKELGQPGYKPYILGTNNDLRTYEEYKQINAAWKSGFSEGLGGEGLWAEENLVNAAANLTGIAPILLDSGLFLEANRHGDPCETGLVGLSRIISSNVEYRNPVNPDHVLKFTLLNYTGGHYNGILFRYRTDNDSGEDTPSDEEKRWRSVANDFKSLPDSIKQTIFMNFFIIPMKDKSKIRKSDTIYQTFNKEDFDEDGNYTGVMFSQFDPSDVDGISEFIRGLGIDPDDLETAGITPEDWFNVVVAKIDGLQSQLKIVSNAVASQKELDIAEAALSKMNNKKPKTGRIPRVTPRNTRMQQARKAKLESDVALLTRKLSGLQLQEDEDHAYHGKGISGSLVDSLGADKVFRILETIPGHMGIRGVNDKIYVAPILAWMHLSDLVESRGELARNSKLVEVAQTEPEVLEDIKDLLEEVNVRACPLSRNRFSNIRADADDMSVTVKSLATEFYEEVVLNRIADQEEIDDSDDWFNEAMEFWCNMSEYERIKYYMDYIFEASSYPQEIETEGETSEEIDDRIYQDFMSCSDLRDDVDWVGRYLNQPDFYRVQYSPGDGNCFFWSLAQALYFIKENETVKGGKKDVWEALAQQLRHDTSQTITRDMYDSKVEILNMYKNLRAVQSLERQLGVLRPKLRRIRRSSGVDPTAQHRFESIEKILDDLNETRATAYQPILFNRSLFIATDPSDIIGRKAPKGMRVIKYYDQGIRKSIRASYNVFEKESRLLASLSPTEKAGIIGDEEFGCFGLMPPALVDTLGVVFEESSAEEESDEFELCSSAEDEDQCGELASAGSPCYWDFEEETCNSYE